MRSSKAAPRDVAGVAWARETLLTAYAFIDGHLEGRIWVSGDEFSIAGAAALDAMEAWVARRKAQLNAQFDRLDAYLAEQTRQGDPMKYPPSTHTEFVIERELAAVPAAVPSCADAHLSDRVASWIRLGSRDRVRDG